MRALGNDRAVGDDALFERRARADLHIVPQDRRLDARRGIDAGVPARGAGPPSAAEVFQ